MLTGRAGLEVNVNVGACQWSLSGPEWPAWAHGTRRGIPGWLLDAGLLDEGRLLAGCSLNDDISEVVCLNVLVLR